MIHLPRPRPAWRAALLALAGAVLGGAAPSRAALDVPVVVEGRALAPLLGRRIGSLGLLAWRDGGWRAIPFQIDPRVLLERPGRATRLVHVLRARGERDPIPARPLGPRDEVVFMREDAGAEPPVPGGPPGARAGVLLRIAGGGAAGLFAFDGPPPRSSLRYVRYNEAADRIDARTYSLAFSRSDPLVFDTLRIRGAGESAGGPAALSPNLIDRIKVRIRGRILHAIPVSRTEADFETRRDGAREGPVRIVRGSRQRLSMLLGLKSPEVEEEQLFLPDGFEFPIWFVKSGALNRVATRLDVRAGPDWSSAALGMRVRVEGEREEATVDGRMEDAERRLTTQGPTWNLLHGPQGAVLTKLETLSGPGGPPRAGLGTWYRDDRDARDPPEREPGTLGAVGFDLTDLARLGPGEYHWAVLTRVMPRYHEGDERAALEAITLAPRVSVVPLTIRDGDAR